MIKKHENPWSSEVDKTDLIIYLSSWIAGLVFSLASVGRNILENFVPHVLLFFDNFLYFKMLLFILAMLSIVLTIARKVLNMIYSGLIMTVIACCGFFSGYLMMLRWELGIVIFFIGLVYVLKNKLITNAVYSGR